MKQFNDTTSSEKGFYKLSWLQRIGFGSGDLAQNLIFQTTCMYLLFFYTDIYGLDAVDVSVMFTVGNVANVIWDPIVGALIDKNNPRLGKYRAYLVFVGIPLSGFAILCFWNGFAPSLLYAYVTYIAMTLLYTFINVPYGALNSSLTRDTNEITILTSVRMFMAVLPLVRVCLCSSPISPTIRPTVCPRTQAHGSPPWPSMPSWVSACFCSASRSVRRRW